MAPVSPRHTTTASDFDPPRDVWEGRLARFEPNRAPMTTVPSSPQPRTDEDILAQLVTELDKRMRSLGLGIVAPLSVFTDLRPSMPTLSPILIRQTIAQADLLLRRYYVHLASKRALYSSDPLQALRILQTDVSDRRLMNDPMPDREFHDRMSAIFAGLHDRHTRYYLPTPYRRTLAFLPLLLELVSGGDGDDAHYVVTKIAGKAYRGTDFELSGQPLVVTHWNGVPIEVAVERSGQRSGGANRAARLARGLDRLTIAWLGLTSGPDEDTVALTYRVGDTTITKRFEWLAVRRPDDAPVTDPREADAATLARDPEGEWIRDVKEKLFHDRDRPDPKVETIEQIATYRTWPPPNGDAPVAAAGSVAAGAAPAGPAKTCGYLRIYTFAVEDGREEAFRKRIREVIAQAPADGLIIDIRGNPGGDAVLAEDLAEMLALGGIEREGLQFLNTPEAATLAARYYAAAAQSIEIAGFLQEARATGSPFVSSPPFAAGRPEHAATPQQVYSGPVVLIIDANCYSASEIFAAALQDHERAVIIGTHQQTGGGGGNPWSCDLLRQHCGPDEVAGLAPLPGDASFDLALRRTTRVGRRAGLPLEDMGVVAEEVRGLTLRDALEGNADLLDFALECMPGKPPLEVRARFRNDTNAGFETFTIEASRGIDRVDVYVNEFPVVSITRPDGRKVRLPGHVVPARTARFVPYASGHIEPVAKAFRWRRHQ